MASSESGVVTDGKINICMGGFQPINVKEQDRVGEEDALYVFMDATKEYDKEEINKEPASIKLQGEFDKNKEKREPKEDKKELKDDNEAKRE